MPINLDELNKKGWCEIYDSSNNEEDLIAIANSLGKILLHPNGNKIDILRPKNKIKAIKNSFSYNYEYDAFPLHTDTAFWNIPARYVMLSSEEKNSTATTITHTNELTNLLSKEELHEIENSIFIVKTQNVSFYTKLINHDSNNFFFRYDSNCMKALNKCAKNAEKILKKKFKLLQIERISWTKSKILVFDNWKTFHGRESINTNENRRLKRIYIKQI